jgi:hypothetical protein
MENTKLVWNTTNGASAFSFHNGLTLTIEQSATAGGFSFVVMNTPRGTEMPDLVWEGIELCISDADNHGGPRKPDKNAWSRHRPRRQH